jgi:hypothetical protein
VLTDYHADYHAKYFAHELTKRCASDSLEKLAGAVAGAQVDAALFSFRFRPFEGEAIRWSLR